MPIYANITTEKYWNDIREIVRAGQSSTYLPVGKILYDTADSTTGTAFQVVGNNKHFDPDLTAQGYTNSITLCQVKLDIRQLDAIQAFIYLEKEMQAGVYRFTIPNYDAANGGNKTYYFTTTKNVPIGGQVVLSWPSNQTPKNVSTYDSYTNATEIESSLTLTEWDSSVTVENLGTISLSTTITTSEYGKLNHIHRARYGSNNYAQSGIRQILNSNKLANQWWQPTSIFSRPYGNRAVNGYLTTLNSDFVNVLGTPEITCISNNTFEYQSLDGTTYPLNTTYTVRDKMFLLSHTEVNLSFSPNIGTVLDYYSTHSSNSDRIKYRKDNNNAYYWWLRAPHPSHAHGERIVYTSGALINSYANNSNGSAPACIIQ